MTQKEAIKNILGSISLEHFRALFISNWLEDINWHSENKLFCEQYMNEGMVKYWIKVSEQKNAAMTRHELNIAEKFYSPVNYIWGWGITTKDWTSEGSGQAFVDELAELAGLKKLTPSLEIVTTKGTFTSMADAKKAGIDTEKLYGPMRSHDGGMNRYEDSEMNDILSR